MIIKRTIENEFIIYPSPASQEVDARMRITVPESGLYRVSLFVFHQNAGANSNVESEIFVNGTKALFTIRMYGNTASSLFFGQYYEGFYYLKKNDELKLYGRNYPSTSGGLYSDSPSAELILEKKER